jgi:hypothetical protein
LNNIAGHLVTVHCTITGLMADRENYFEEFLRFWSEKPEIRKIWFSLFTPQVGAEADEILTPIKRDEVLAELTRLRPKFSKLDLPESVMNGYRRPPASPDECIFARTTLNITADLKGRITPCQFGGNPDCSKCGCMASAGLKAVGDHRLFGMFPLRHIFRLSDQVGRMASKRRNGDVAQTGGIHTA